MQDIVDEIVDALTTGQAVFSVMPPELIEIHFRDDLEVIATTRLPDRLGLVHDLIVKNAPLWQPGLAVVPDQLKSDRFLQDFGNPWPNEIRRIFRRIGILDIFSAVTRTKKSEFEQTINDLVWKRNQIAHGELTVTSTGSDVARYQLTVRTFCERVDRASSRRIRQLCPGVAPW